MSIDKKVRLQCKECGGEDTLWKDATVSWDIKKQEWVYNGDYHDGIYCNSMDCMCDQVEVDEIPIVPENLAEMQEILGQVPGPVHLFKKRVRIVRHGME